MSVADVIRNAEKAVDRYDALKENSGMTYEDGYDWAERFRGHIIDLLALDADDRLAKAEAALSRCASAAGNCHPADGCRSVLAIHRDYFAEKGDDRG